MRESIRTPAAFLAPGWANATMPDLGLSEGEIDALTAYLLTPKTED